MNERMINYLVKRFTYSGISFEELKSEAIKCSLEAKKRYDCNKGASYNTWQYEYVMNGLRSMVKQELDWQNHRFNSNVAADDLLKGLDFFQSNEQDDKNRAIEDSFSSSSSFIPETVEMLSSLSKEAKEVCSVIFSAPGEYATLMPKMARGALVKKCREKGWSWPVIWRTFNEIKTALGGV